MTGGAIPAQLNALRIQFVPEPGALIGLGAVLAGLGLLARRRRR